MPRLAFACFIVFVIAFSGCMNFKLIAVDKKTQLENQILGSFGELQKDLVLLQSVRGDGTQAALPPAQREAILAMLNRQFNMDDINVLKEQGLLGEARSGLLVWLDDKRAPTGDVSIEEAKRLLEEENEDRRVFMRRVLDINPKLTEKDMPLVREMMFRLNVEGSAYGVMIEGDDGTFKPKTAEGRGA